MIYLNEAYLGILLAKIYPEHEFIHDKIVPNSNSKKRPDYRNDELRIIIEFDGDRHYRDATKIKSEHQKNLIYSSLGYKIIRIPYFVQLTTQTVSNFFNTNFNPDYQFPHGFISEHATLPANYCELGVKKFLLDLDKFDFIQAEIINSLKNKIEILNDIELVLPPSLFYLIK